MAQKYEILHEVGWDDRTNTPEYDKLTTIKNEQAAINFIHDMGNIGKYGNMVVRTKSNGVTWTYNEHNHCWNK